MEADRVDWRALNRANWDSRVPVHLASSLYDLAGFRAGASSLRPFEVSEVGPVAGRSLVHLQCHIGLDTLSWARLGAVVSGLDFSALAISAASSLASDLGLAARFVVADVYDAVQAFGGQRFDIVYTGVGALVWLPDIVGWARVVAGLLAPGGFLYLVEGHQFAQVLDSGLSGLVVTRDYFDDAPQVDDFPYTYTDGPPLAHPRQVEFQHQLGEIVSALAEAGLRIEFLHEFDFDAFQRFELLERSEDGLFRFPAGQPRVPMMFSLRASARLGGLGLRAAGFGCVRPGSGACGAALADAGGGCGVWGAYAALALRISGVDIGLGVDLVHYGPPKSPQGPNPPQGAACFSNWRATRGWMGFWDGGGSRFRQETPGGSRRPPEEVWAGGRRYATG